MEAGMSSAPSSQICRPFSVDEIQSATHNFDDALVIGAGGFGKVYKATINVENGESFVVAIKRLDPMSSQGAPEFWAEVEMLTKLRHCNLVSLIGYCNDNSEMILVYEFMPRGTLCDHLLKHGASLSWVQRLKMSIGAARGLHYLHTGTGTQHGVIHRDVKTSNILLDKDYDAKISDFGLSKIGPTDTSGAYVNTLIRGTFGYLDPEYFLTGRLTRKSDVFAFGVVLFELLCGRAALDTSLDEDECSLVKWAHESIEKGKVQEIIDSNIKSQIFPKCLKVFVQIADRCLSSESKKRPTMAEILVALEHSLTLQNKFDNRAKPAAAGMLSIARMIKWPFISPEVNSAPTNSKPSTVNEVTIGHSSSSKEASVYHGLGASLSIGGEQVVAGWPAWLVAVAGEALNAWLPRRADTFEKIDKIGQGMYSNVYKARDLLSNKIVALKKVRFDFTDVESVKFMAREILTLRRLDHPNVIKLEGLITSQASASLYFVFEYMEHDLTGLVTLHGVKFTEPQVKCYMTQLLNGLDHCHSRSVLHRDIKGSNLLIDNNGILKIADFGSATFFNPNLTVPLTSRVVTLWYRPPELILGATQYGVGVDLWSAGCILGELYAGKPIMPGRTEVEQLHKIFKLCGSPSDSYWKKSKLPHATVFKPPQPYVNRILEVFKDFPPVAIELIQTLLAMDPEQRGTASLALKSEFFTTEPHACDPSEKLMLI